MVYREGVLREPVSLRKETGSRALRKETVRALARAGWLVVDFVSLAIGLLSWFVAVGLLAVAFG